MTAGSCFRNALWYQPKLSTQHFLDTGRLFFH